MKVLTLHQPWASLVALGVKTIETRSWSTKYRGPLAIHAGARRPPYPLPVDNGTTICSTHPLDDDRYSTGIYIEGRGGFSLPLGAIVATCTLVDVVPVRATRPETMADAFVIDYDGRLTAFHGLDTDGWGASWGGGFGAYAWAIEDQRPYGDFTPGRYAWLLADIKPVDPPVPFKGGQGLTRTWEPEAVPA